MNAICAPFSAVDSSWASAMRLDSEDSGSAVGVAAEGRVMSCVIVPTGTLPSTVACAVHFATMRCSAGSFGTSG